MQLFVACLLLVASIANVRCSLGRPDAVGDPGFQVVLTDKGLDEIRRVGVPILEKELQDISIPNIGGHASGIDAHYDLTEIHATSLTIPTSLVTVVPGTGIKVNGSGAQMHINGRWDYRMDWWPHVSDSGSCDISISEITLSLTVSLGSDSTGHLTLDTVQCACNVGHMSIDFHGGASWLYNLFSSTLASSIKGSLSGKICSAGTQAINTQGNAAVETLPVVVDVDDLAQIDYALIAQPRFDMTGFVETSHKGEFLLRAHATQPPFVPPSLPTASTAADRMMYIWLSSYLPNSAGYVFQQAGVLHYTITPNMVPSGIPFQLNTKTFKDIVPELYKMYPDMPMELEVNNTSPMSVASTPEILTGVIPGTIKVLVQNGSSTVEAFTLQALIHANATVGLYSNNSKQYINAKASYLYTNMTLLHSGIGPFSVPLLDSTVNALCELAVIPFLNTILEKGISIPTVDGVALVNPQIQLGQDYVLVETDFSYTPSFSVKSQAIRIN